MKTLKPTEVRVIGTERQLPTSQVKAVIGTRKFTRLTATDPAKVTWKGVISDTFGSIDDRERLPYLALASDTLLPEAAAAVQLRDHHVVIAPKSGKLAARSTDGGTPTMYVSPVVVGGTSAIPAKRQKELLSDFSAKPNAAPQQLAGADRYATGALVAQRAFPEGAETAYLVSGVNGADAAAAATIADGPVFLVPPRGDLPPTVRAALQQMGPRRIVAVGGKAAVSDAMLVSAGKSVTPRAATTATDVIVSQLDEACALTAEGTVRCWQVGLPDRQRRADARHITVTGLPAKATALANGPSVSCAVSAGQLWCWDPTDRVSHKARLISGTISGIVDYRADRDAGCALDRNGVVWCHGQNQPGAEPFSTLTPLKRVKGMPKVTSMSAAHGGVCGLTSAQEVWCALFPWDGVDMTSQGPTDKAIFPNGWTAAHKAPVPGKPVELHLSYEHAVFRYADGVVRTISLHDLGRRTPEEVKVWPVRARALIPDSDACYLAAKDSKSCAPSRKL